MADNNWCQCEHGNHEGGKAGLAKKPHCDHPYGQSFAPEDLRVVNTHYGAFTMCRPCADSIPAEYLR